MLGLKKIVVCLFATIFVFAVSCTRKQSKELSVQSSVRVEAATFRQHCVICHGAEATGKDIGGRITPSLRTGDVLQKTDEHLYSQISNGGNGMPPFKYQLSEKEVQNMVKFIRDLQKTEP